LLLVLLPLLLLALPASAARTIRVGMYENAPKIFTEDGEPTGFFIELLEHIAAAEDWDIEYVPGMWAEGLGRLERGEIDLMPDVALTPERERIYTFHQVPVLSSWFQVCTPADVGIRSILDLNGKRVVVLKGSVQQQAFEKIRRGFGLQVELVGIDDVDEMFRMLQAGEADAVITNRFNALRMMRELGLQDTGIVFEPSDLYYAAPRGRGADLLAAIDRHLDELKREQNSVYYRELSRWTSVEVEFALPNWARILGLVILTGLAASLVGGVLLKYQVDAKTAELRRINHEMEDRIADRTAELAAAVERAEEADRIKSAFLATMSHELRTPLNSIIGFTGIMLQGLAGPLNEEQSKQMALVQKSARHLLALINDVLDISKIEAGQLTLASESVDVRGAIEKTVGVVSPLARKKSITLETVIAPGVGPIISDQRRLEQVILNLLTNAVKFTEKGGVRVECRTEGEWLVLTVADTGCGIAQGDLGRIFHAFHQVDTGLARRQEGTGLGLSICERIVTMMGGAITVESEVDKGSRFTVRVPLNQEPVA
jgi:signal transduction histidine kinase